VSPDKRAHLMWGTAAALATVALLLAAQHIGGPAAVALAGPVVGWALERYQAVRREGVASWADAVATAAPFEVVALLWHLILNYPR
jgi:hypothetical protein